MAIGFTLFDTAIGSCAVAWSEAGILSVQIPEANEPRTRARMLRSFPGAREKAPPPSVEAAILAITALLNGEKPDLSGIVLDMQRIASFQRRVYEVARTIPPGSTLTYGDIATRLGEPGAAQAVGRALGQNPFGIVVPCHRVLGTGGKTGGFSASGGVATKLRILTIEGAHHSGESTLFDELPFQAKSKG
jgi:methylated-DNA-[protein]-cysteine S-methyltransferase